MTGTDILVLIMGIIAGGVGIFCFLSEHFSSEKEKKTMKGEKEGKDK